MQYTWAELQTAAFKNSLTVESTVSVHTGNYIKHMKIFNEREFVRISSFFEVSLSNKLATNWVSTACDLCLFIIAVYKLCRTIVGCPSRFVFVVNW